MTHDKVFDIWSITPPNFLLIQIYEGCPKSKVPLGANWLELWMLKTQCYGSKAIFLVTASTLILRTCVCHVTIKQWVDIDMQVLIGFLHVMDKNLNLGLQTTQVTAHRRVFLFFFSRKFRLVRLATLDMRIIVF